MNNPWHHEVVIFYLILLLLILGPLAYLFGADSRVDEAERLRRYGAR